MIVFHATQQVPWTSAMEVRRLGSADAVEFQALRMRALREHPEAYGSSEEEEAALPLEDIALAVTVGNRAARALYIAAGFVPYCVESRYIKVGDRAYDIELLSLDLRPMWVASGRPVRYTTPCTAA